MCEGVSIRLGAWEARLKKGYCGGGWVAVGWRDPRRRMLGYPRLLGFVGIVGYDMTGLWR